jgi:hypothetical protein
MSEFTDGIALAAVADVLFCSGLTPEHRPNGGQVFTAVRETLATHGEWQDCMRVVADAFALDPNAAASRLCWCRATVAEAWSGNERPA